MASFQVGRLAVAVAGLAILAACDDGFQFGKNSSSDGADTTRAESPAVRLVDRDVEMPEVFQATEDGLWDGRPSLGGVWVAYPDVQDPERVIIRNEANGKHVVGALFRRERENPGPKIQVSSDAAAALGLLAGAPARLNVTALRRQEVPIADETPSSGEPALDAPEEIETASLDPIAAAEAALSEADPPPAAATRTERKPEPAVEAGSNQEIAKAEPPAAPEASPDAQPASEVATVPEEPKPGLFGRNKRPNKPFIQIGLFSVESNANSAGEQLRQNGVVPTIEEQVKDGKTFYRVIVGPATTNAERSALMKKVKGLGFTDAYLVSS